MKTTSTRDVGPFPRGYLYVLGACAVISAFALVIGVVGTITNQRQDAEARAANSARDREAARLLECFDQYAALSAATSQAVRDASVDLAAATTARDVALDGVFTYIATDPPEDSPRGRTLFGQLLASNAALVDSQAELAKVRRENPVPDPPSSFCEA